MLASASILIPKGWSLMESLLTLLIELIGGVAGGSIAV